MLDAINERRKRRLIMKYDIFISYKRRAASSATAAYLYEFLRQKGYNVFFDRKEMRSGKFNEQLLEHISNATDILILLEEGSLGAWFDNRPAKESRVAIADDTSEENEISPGLQEEEPYKTDWFCKEVMHSLRLQGKNLVPVLLNGYRMPEGKDLPPEMSALSLHNALSLDISDVETFYEKYLVEQEYLKSRPVNLSLSKTFQSKGGVVGSFLFYTDAISCDIYECGEMIATLTDNEDEWHPFRYPVSFAGEHRFKVINNDSCEVIVIESTIEVNCQKYVQVLFSDKRNLWDLTQEEIASQDNVEVLYKWGLGLFYGTSNHDPDIVRSYECLNRAIDLGFQDAIAFVSSQGSNLISQKKAPVDVALKWYQFAAEHGNEEAQENLGRAYRNGQGVEQDYKKALEWFTKAAEQGHAVSQSSLANMYRNGFGVEQNYEKAVEWYTKAAEQGDVTGQANLGNAYHHGRGVERNYEKAIEWYTKAAERGNAYSQNRLGGLYFEGKVVEKDYGKAIEWYTKAAEQGYAAGQSNLANMYHHGFGVKRSYKKAIEWYTKAAEQGNAYSQVRLGGLYLKGEGVSQNYEKAIEWYTKAAEQGDAFSQNRLGDMYFNGEGVDKDYEKALEWYKNAADKNYTRVFNSLAWLYHLIGDYDKALPWAEKAINAKPDNPNIIDTLATVYQGLGRYDDALSKFEECLHIYEEKGDEDGKQRTIDKIQALKEKRV